MSIALLSSEDRLSPGIYRTPCAVSGGTLESFLRSAMELTDGKLCIILRQTAVSFPLPCPEGQGQIVPEAEKNRMRNTHKSHFSRALGTNYLTYLREDRLHCLLFDTVESLGYKLRLADSLGVPWALVPDKDLLHQLKG